MKSRRLRNLILMISAPLLLFSFLYLVFIIPPRLYNNAKVQDLMQSLESISLPADSTVLATDHQFGALSGASNHCDVLALLLIESDLDPETFFQFFEGKVALDLPYSEESLTNLSVYTIEEDRLFIINKSGKEEITDMSYSDAHSKRNLMELPNQFTTTEGKNLYLVSAWDQTFEGYAMKDFRCR